MRRALRLVPLGVAGVGAAASFFLQREGCEGCDGDSVAAMGCMDRHRAQESTRGVLVRGILSPKEVDLVHSTVAKVSGLCGQKSIDADGVFRTVGTHRWTFLHTDSVFDAHFPWLRDRIWQTCRRVDEEEGWGLLSRPGGARFRTVEHHVYTEGGGLIDENHIDTGSLVTIDIMLARPGEDFEGGDLCLPTKDGAPNAADFKLGDAVVFVSHKAHYVRPLTKGRRSVLIAELWAGEARTCAHRCDSFAGECHVNRLVSRVDHLMQGQTDGVRDLF